MTISPARNACDDVVNLATAPVAVGRNHHLSCLAARRALHSHQMEQRSVRLASQGRCCGSRVCTPAYAVMGVRLRARAMRTCVLRMTCSRTLPFLVRVLNCVQRVIVWCGHNNRQGESVSCVKSAVKSAVNSHTLHHLPRALRNTQALRSNGNPSYEHLGYLTPP